MGNNYNEYFRYTCRVYKYSTLGRIMVSDLIEYILILSPSPQKTHVGMPSSGDVYTTLDMTKNDKSSESSIGKLKLSTIVERPAIMKKCG